MFELQRPTPADLKAVYEHFATTAVDIFNKSGETAAQLFAIRLGAEEGVIEAIVGLPPELINIIQSSAETKGSFKPLVRALLDEASPFGQQFKEQGIPTPHLAVHVTEAWIAQMAYESLGKDGDYDGLPPSQRPDRKEVILVGLHTLDYSTIGLNPIHDEPTRHAEVGELNLDSIQTGLMSMTPEEAQPGRAQ